MKNFMFLIPGLFLFGCAGSVPQNISQAPTPNLTLQEAVAQSAIHKNQPVRWGGTILAVTNYAHDTEIEILAEKVDSSGRPVYSNDTQGRFLAKVDGFIDPVIYARGRTMTAYGLMDSLVTRDIGEKPYVYPVVKVQKFHLWPNPSESDYADNSNCGPFSLTAVAGIYPYGYRFGYGRCF